MFQCFDKTTCCGVINVAAFLYGGGLTPSFCGDQFSAAPSLTPEKSNFVNPVLKVRGIASKRTLFIFSAV